MSIKRKFDLSSDETKKECINAIITRLDDALDESIGVITAEDILDIVTTHIGPDIYNNALDDVKVLLSERFADIDVGIELLKDSKQS